MISISGSPIGGENPPHEQGWRERVAEHCAEAAPSRSVALAFRVEPHRRVDLDNLIRPALAGMRDAGIFRWGYRNLDLLVAAKQPTDSPGLDIVLDDSEVRAHLDRPGPVLLRATSSTLPRDGDRASKAAWRDRVAGSLIDRINGDECWVVIETNTTLSLEGIMKPVIDGLEPLLGRDPRGRLEFVPHDDKIVYLVVRRRKDTEQVLDVTAGAISQ